MLNKKNDKTISNKSSDFIPVVCHYDEETLLTKNSDLLQVIKVTGFEPNDEFFQTKSLRNEIRRVIIDHIPSSNYAVYYHVIRDRADLISKNKTKNESINIINDLWCSQNNWDKQLVNTLYITVVKQGIRFSVLNIIDMLQSMFFPAIKRKYFKHFERAVKELTKVTIEIEKALKRFGGEILKIKKENDDYISEPLSFFHNLIHLRQKKIKINQYDESDYLTKLSIQYQFNTLELCTGKEKRYAAIFAIKPPLETDFQFFDSLLQLGQNFILCESNVFAPAHLALKQFKQFKDIATAAKNEEIAHTTTLKDILENDHGNSTDFCRRQITLTVYSDELYYFTQKINKTVLKLKNIGLVVTREDFNLATAYFSCVPGNFHYINRITYTATKLAASFTSIHSRSIGCYNGSKWGEAVTLFRSLYGTPYYFNFHSNNNGNTLIIGPKGSGKTILTHFLLMQSMKFNPKIIYVDFEQSAINLMKHINGTSIKITPNEKSEIQLNPINIANHNNDINLFAAWLLKTLTKADKILYTNKKYISIFYQLAQNIVKIQDLEEQYKLIASTINKLGDGKIKENYQKMINSDYYFNLYSTDNLEIINQHKVLRIDISECVKQEEIINSFLGLFLSNLPNTLTGEPTIIVLNHAHNIFNTYTFENRINTLLENLTEKNAIALFAQEKQVDSYKALRKCIKNFATQLYLSDRTADKNFRTAFNLTQKELNHIKSYHISKRRFLIKHNNDSLITSVDLSNLKQALEILGI